jgi:hypothetical protein
VAGGGAARELVVAVGVPIWGICSGGLIVVEGADSWVRGVRGIGGKLGEVVTEAARSRCGSSAVRCPTAEEEGGVDCFEASRRRRGG